MRIVQVCKVLLLYAQLFLTTRYYYFSGYAVQHFF